MVRDAPARPDALAGPNSPRLSVIDALRGFAALAVCWGHLTQGRTDFLPAGFLRSTGTYGWLGVEMFFVISGFIIPYTLHRNRYQVSDYGVFILKRIVRLDPPYLAGILIVILLGYASSAAPEFQGVPFQTSVRQILLHLGYVNAFVGEPWLNPVYWTLAIELQYYLLIGVLFPAVAHDSAMVRAATFLGLAGVALLSPSGQFVFHWLYLFMMGMAAFQLHTGKITRAQFLGLVALFGCGAWYVSGVAIALTGSVTALLIGLLRFNAGPGLLFFGQISYSLYLLHVPVGGRVINLSMRYVEDFTGKVAVLAVAMALSISAAWLLYRFVEAPAQRWSSRIRYRSSAKLGRADGESRVSP